MMNIPCHSCNTSSPCLLPCRLSDSVSRSWARWGPHPDTHAYDTQHVTSRTNSEHMHIRISISIVCTRACHMLCQRYLTLIIVIRSFRSSCCRTFSIETSLHTYTQHMCTQQANIVRAHVTKSCARTCEIQRTHISHVHAYFLLLLLPRHIPVVREFGTLHIDHVTCTHDEHMSTSGHAASLTLIVRHAVECDVM